MNLPKRNSADGRCYWMKPEVQKELQEKYFVVTGREDDHFWNREYSLKPGIYAEKVPEPLLRFACYVI